MVRNIDKRLLANLDRAIRNRPICLVGNAASLLSSKHGVAIDEGCVVRLNSGVPINAAAQGRRVDIHCFSTLSSFQSNMKKASWRVRLRRRYFDHALSIWMSGSERNLSQNPAQEFYPLDLLEDLSKQLGATPSVGAKALHLLSELTDAEIRMFGFDFKQTKTFYRTKENPGSHNWSAEMEFALSLQRKGRVKLY